MEELNDRPHRYVHRRTGGLEKWKFDVANARRVHRRTGGLERGFHDPSRASDVHRRTGGLEIH